MLATRPNHHPSIVSKADMFEHKETLAWNPFVKSNDKHWIFGKLQMSLITELFNPLPGELQRGSLKTSKEDEVFQMSSVDTAVFDAAILFSDLRISSRSSGNQLNSSIPTSWRSIDLKVTSPISSSITSRSKLNALHQKTIVPPTGSKFRRNSI